MSNIDIERTAQIAFLKLTDDEKKRIESSILNDLEKLDTAGDLSGVEPTTKITKNITYRKDEVIPSVNRDDLLKNAKGSSNGAFTVPKIVE